LRNLLKNPWIQRFLLSCLLIAPVCPTISAQTNPARSSGYRIAGTVVNAATGDPVRGATVAALSHADSHTIASVESNDDGHFEIAGLPPAKYQLTASRRGYRTAFFDEHDEFSTAIVTGPEQETDRLTFRLTPGGVIRGLVLTDGGDPVFDARVMLFRKAAPGHAGAKILQADGTTTDDTGAYEFAGLAPGEYTIAVVAEPWYADNRASRARRTASSDAPESNPALDVAYPVTYFDSTTEEASATPLIVTGGSRQEADITLHAVPALHIDVQTPRRPDGSIARAELRQMVFGVQVSAVNGGFFDSMEGGSMEFRGVAPGQYELSQGDPPRVTQLDATSNLQVDPSLGAAEVSVNGTLRSTAGPFPPNAMVVLVPADGQRRQNSIPTTCIRGAFSFPMVPPGEWELQVGSADTPNAKPLAVLSITTDGKTHAGDLIVVRDKPLTVQATAGQGSTDVQGFARRDQSDSDGSFSLRDAIPGDYTLVAIQDGWEIDWSQPDGIARYLPGGLAVTVSADAGKLLTLTTPVPVQNRLP
jgi:hypothetical protein